MRMGFPVGYSELHLPRVLLHIVFFLGEVRQFITWFFEAVGLRDLLDSDAPWPEFAASGHQDHHHHHQGFRWASLMLHIDEALPVVRYGELDGGDGGHVGGSCAVCLYEFEADEEVRRLSNCRHVYHRGCLDSWLEHGQRTCPLCRTPLVGGGAGGEAAAARLDVASDPVWVSGVASPDIFEDDDFMINSFSSSSSLAASAPSPSPAMLLPPHQFVLY